MSIWKVSLRGGVGTSGKGKAETDAIFYYCHSLYKKGMEEDKIQRLKNIISDNSMSGLSVFLQFLQSACHVILINLCKF